MTEIDDVVRRLVEQHCPGELADAILDDAHDLDALTQVCGRISGGDPASISVILSELADNPNPARSERDPGRAGRTGGRARRTGPHPSR